MMIKFLKNITKDEKIDTTIKNSEYMETLNKNGQTLDRNAMTRVYKIIDGLEKYLE